MHWTCIAASQVDSARLRLLARLLPPPTNTPPDTNTDLQPSTAAAVAATGAGTGGESAAAAAAAVAAAAGGGLGLEGETSPLLDGIVSRQPLLLVANVDELLDELARWVCHPGGGGGGGGCFVEGGRGTTERLTLGCVFGEGGVLRDVGTWHWVSLGV